MTHWCDDSCTSDNCMTKLRAELDAETDRMIHAQNEIGQLKVAVSAANEKLAELAAVAVELDKYITPEQRQHGNPPSIHTAAAILTAIERRVHASFIRSAGLTCDDADERLGPHATIEDAEAWLAAHNKTQWRKGAAWALRQALDDCESVVYADLAPGFAVGERKLLGRIAAIEHGEVEVGE